MDHRQLIQFVRLLPSYVRACMYKQPLNAAEVKVNERKGCAINFTEFQDNFFPTAIICSVQAAALPKFGIEFVMGSVSTPRARQRTIKTLFYVSEPFSRKA